MAKQDVYQFELRGKIAYDPNKPAELVNAMDAFTQLKASAEKLGITLIKAAAKTSRAKE